MRVQLATCAGLHALRTRLRARRHSDAALRLNTAPLRTLVSKGHEHHAG